MASDREKSIQQAREELRNAGYRCINSHILRDGNTKTGELWFYAGNGEVVILAAIWEAGEGWTGWDVYAPISQSNKTDDTLAAIRARATPEAA